MKSNAVIHERKARCLLRFKDLICCFVLFIGPPLACADVFKWTDDHGHVHYSDFLPSGENAKTLDVKDAVNFVPVQATTLKFSKKSRKKPAKAKVARKPVFKHAADAKNARQCEAMANLLHKLQQKLRAGYTEPRGNDLRDRRRQLRMQYSKNCV